MSTLKVFLNHPLLSMVGHIIRKEDDGSIGGIVQEMPNNTSLNAAWMSRRDTEELQQSLNASIPAIPRIMIGS